MTSRDEVDGDDDFSEIYKAYTGPLGSNAPAPTTEDKTTTNKRSNAGSDEEEETRDPNAVPTDFTSREAKVWEAKSKATERNWKKRKEEEMICKICGESGHFTQGCPSTLGANRKSQDFFERVPAREPHVKALFSEKVVSNIEKDIGCKIKIEEKFIIVSGKDRLILKKGVEAVHKIKEEGESKAVHKLPEESDHKVSPRSPISRSRSPQRRSPGTSRFGRSDSQKSNRSPNVNTGHIPHRYGRQERLVEDSVREDLQRMSGGSLQAYGSDGGRGRSSLSKSPMRTSYLGNPYNSYEVRSQSRGDYRPDGWNANRDGPDMHPGRNLDYPPLPKSLEELELQYRREAMELARFRDKEEDEENYKHREVVNEMREGYMKKVVMLKDTHEKMWEDFLQHEGHRRQPARHYISTSALGGYKQPGYPEFENSSANIHNSESNNPVESRSRYRDAMDSYPSSRPHDTYGNYQRYRRGDDFGKPYNRF